MKNKLLKYAVPAAFAGVLLFFSLRASASEKKSKVRESTIAERIAGLGPDFAEPVEDVILLKEILGAWGYNPGPLNGIWTVQTSNAVKAFQKDHGLRMTGEIDNMTPNMLAGKEQRIEQRLQGIAGVL